MAEARGRDAWAHTSTVLAMIANVNRDPKKTPAFQPADFDPHQLAEPRRRKIDQGTAFRLLETMFVKQEEARP